MNLRPILLLAFAASLTGGATLAATNYASERAAIVARYAAEAKQANPNFHGFSADAGKAFFLAHPGTGRPETPSCTTCHTTSPRNYGRTRAGKQLLPVAVSRTPARFTNLTKVERWFKRNCNTVYGRTCTAQEKGNYITFMESQ
ncbi:MAG: DUF1924 domain-containing protein [Rhodospirillales bacterium]|nr:DUF1924 domain-containing protein [Rhodospirillales bacterium]MDE2200631.1 DUF1924 domain-containing protein [Rhodospirillales bacterium]MDE2573719.1 DUF1924 domain-containing protein [Rhodospirillales bacterium]